MFKRRGFIGLGPGLGRSRKPKARVGKGRSAYHRCISSTMKGVRGSAPKRQGAFASAVRKCKRLGK